MRQTSFIADTAIMKSMRMSVALLCLLQACRGCENPLTDAPGGLQGQVCYHSDVGERRYGEPYTGRVVAKRLTDGVEIVTDSQGDGSFTFPSVVDGQYEVYAQDGDFRQQVTTFVEVNSFVEAAVTAETDSTGKPIAWKFEDGACVVPVGPSNGCVSGTICNRHTGTIDETTEVVLRVGTTSSSAPVNQEDGTFNVCVGRSGPGTLEITGSNPRTYAVVLPQGGDVVLDLAQGRCSADDNPPFGNIRGYLCVPGTTDDNSGVMVTISGPAGSATPQTISEPTTTQGTFFFSGLDPGTYSVVAGAFQTNVDVLPNDTTDVTDTVNCADIVPVGSVVGTSCDANTQVDLVNEAGIVVATITSNGAGRIEFVDVLPGIYTLRIASTPTPRIIGPFTVVSNDWAAPITEDFDACNTSGNCEDITLDPRQVSDGRILLVIDRSGSMAEGGKWTFTQEAMRALLVGDSPLATSVDVGLMLYPLGDEACGTGALLEPISSSSRQAIMAALDDPANAPNGGTPTAATMNIARGVVEQALTGASATRPLAVVLATDGAPNCSVCQPTAANGDSCFARTDTCRCSKNGTLNGVFEGDGDCALVNCLDDGNTYAAIRSISALGIPTYVIGTGAGLDGFDDVMNLMAEAGNSARTDNGATLFYDVRQREELDDALDEITSRILSCSVNIPGDGPIDGAGVVIAVSVGGQEIPRDVSHTDGWDFAANGTRTIDIHGPACDRVNGANTISVQRCEP
jgi:hypothetical protein